MGLVGLAWRLMNERSATSTSSEPAGSAAVPTGPIAPVPPVPPARSAVAPLSGSSSASSASSSGSSAATPAATPASAPSGTDPDAEAGDQATAPVTGRPPVRVRATGPLTRMGPWAPVAGGLVGVIAGCVATVFLAGAADAFPDRLSLVFLVVGLGLTGASVTLLADEVRLGRWRAREAAVRPAAWIDTTAGLLNGLTPARLLLLVGGFVLFLAAWAAIG